MPHKPYSGASLVIAGGPRISNKLAVELGYDAGFGSGACVDDVATFIRLVPQ
ncbi:MAG: hypothetical protein WC421_03730 [Elusimicrobiales bacterium]